MKRSRIIVLAETPIEFLEAKKRSKRGVVPRDIPLPPRFPRSLKPPFEDPAIEALRVFGNIKQHILDWHAANYREEERLYRSMSPLRI